MARPGRRGCANPAMGGRRLFHGAAVVQGKKAAPWSHPRPKSNPHAWEAIAMTIADKAVLVTGAA
jgi:hypothetical protein